MAIIDLDHVNIRTANLEPMVRFYEHVIGLTVGDRPPFNFDGAWLYAGERAVLHLVGVDEQPDGVGPQIEHFAVRAEGLEPMLRRLRGNGTSYSSGIVPGRPIRQVFAPDPDGNNIELQFDSSETAPEDLLADAGQSGS